MEEYISKEEIIDECRRYANHEHNVQFKPDVSKDRKHDSEVAMFMCEHFRKFVKELPSADVRENIHARWESDGHGHIICTACKKAKLNEHRSKFCDSCGAIMDGERPCEHCLYHKENGCTRWVCADIEDKPE